MGHKYNREWVRVLKSQEPVRVVMTLTEVAEDGVLTATPRPEVRGKELIWELDKGDQITFRDGEAKISFQRLNSFINVDQITFYPIN